MRRKIAMAVNPIPVDQRVIDIDSRRFASIDKALVELITNSDDSYARLEASGLPVSGRIRVLYEPHRAGALLIVADQAEGMSFEQACYSLTYGGAHSPLARGEGGGRGYFGRGLKQGIFGLGHGWLETIRDGRFTRIEMFRDENGGYLYDDGGGDRDATQRDYERLDVTGNGTRVAIVAENPRVHIPHYRSVVRAVANNVYLRDAVARRHIEVAHMRQGKITEADGAVRFEEPPARVLLGPDLEHHFEIERKPYPFTLTLKRALNAELVLRGDERTNGLVVISGTAVLDCQLFDYENQTGTEYLYGTVRCPGLIERLGQGGAIISDEREGLNAKDPFVAAFSRAVSRLIAPCVQAEQDQLGRLEHATTSGRTTHMIERILQRMNRAAIQDLGIVIPAADASEGHEFIEDVEHPAALRFSTPFYYREAGHPFHVRLLVDEKQLDDDALLDIETQLPESIRIDPAPQDGTVRDLARDGRIEWTVTGETPGDRGEIMVRAGSHLAWCEVVVAEHGVRHPHHAHHPRRHAARHRVPHDHGEALFMGYELRRLEEEPARAVYSPSERRILINTAAPTVQLYVDGRGHFRDSARLLLAELFIDVISDKLARHSLAKSGREHDMDAHRATKLDIIRRYGSDIHLAFQGE
jgi:hypothetical protein